MKEVIYVLDPDDRVGIRCNDTSGDGYTECRRRKGHPVLTVAYKKLEDDPSKEEVQEVKVEFNHRASKSGTWVTWG